MEAEGSCREELTEAEAEDESVKEVLKDRLRLSSISLSPRWKQPKMAWKFRNQLWLVLPTYPSNSQLASDLEQFARHAGRKSVNMEDVILSAHRNEQLAISLRSICTEIKVREPQSDKKRKKPLKKADRTTTRIASISDL